MIFNTDNKVSDGLVVNKALASTAELKKFKGFISRSISKGENPNQWLDIVY